MNLFEVDIFIIIIVMVFIYLLNVHFSLLSNFSFDVDRNMTSYQGNNNIIQTNCRHQPQILIPGSRILLWADIA